MYIFKCIHTRMYILTYLHMYIYVYIILYTMTKNPFKDDVQTQQINRASSATAPRGYQRVWGGYD